MALNLDECERRETYRRPVTQTDRQTDRPTRDAAEHTTRTTSTYLTIRLHVMHCSAVCMAFCMKLSAMLEEDESVRQDVAGAMTTALLRLRGASCGVVLTQCCPADMAAVRLVGPTKTVDAVRVVVTFSETLQPLH